MEELIRLFTEISPPTAVLLIAFFVIRSNSKQAEQIQTNLSRQAEMQQTNMGAVISLAGTIANSTKVVEQAIVKMTAIQEELFQKARYNIVDDLNTTMAKAEELAESSRQKASAAMDRQLIAIMATLEALTEQLALVATKQDIKALNGTLDELHKISVTLLEISELFRKRELELDTHSGPSEG